MKFNNPLSLEQKKVLCFEVETYPAIYDKSHQHYKDRHERDKIWTKIGDLFRKEYLCNYSNETLKSAWKNIVDARRSYRKKVLQDSKYDCLQRWYLNDPTTFLDPHLDKTQPLLNLKVEQPSFDEDSENVGSGGGGNTYYDDECDASDAGSDTNEKSSSSLTPSLRARERNNTTTAATATGGSTEARAYPISGPTPVIHHHSKPQNVYPKKRKLDSVEEELLKVIREDTESSSVRDRDPDKAFFSALHADFMTLGSEELRDETKEKLFKIVMEAKKVSRANQQEQNQDNTAFTP